MKTTDHYSIQWQGFHSNIINSLEDLKSVEDFVDVTLSCEGKTFKGHKVILSAGSSYFRRILKENPCGHPVLILNDIQVDILEALMTYIYHGNVSVPHNKLQEFLRSAEAFKIKGIVDALNPHQSKVKTELKTEPNGNLFQPEGLIQEDEEKPLAVPSNNSISNNNHINGDLSLLAIAAATTAADNMTVAAAAPCMDDSNPSQPATASKRRKTVPRKLGSYMSSSPARSAFSSGEEDMLIETSSEKENTVTTNSQQIGTTFKLSDKNRMDAVSPRRREKSLDTEPEDHFSTGPEDHFPTVNEEETAINLSKSVGPECLKPSPQPAVHSHTNNTRSLLSAAAMFQQLKHQQQQQQLIPAAQMSTNSSNKDVCGSTTTTCITDTSSGAAAAAAALLGADYGGAAALLSAEQGGTAALLGAEQMAALLDSPLWKSRQPRMCLHCNRMFSNKFNLKQHILNMHTVGREMQCEICNKKVKNKWYLRRHHVTHHGAPLKK